MRLKGEKLRELRKRMGLTIQNFANLSGVSASLISQIERGLVDPTLGTFWKLCQGLNVPIHTFFESEYSKVVVRSNERKIIQLPNSKIKYQLLSPNLQGDIEFLLVEIEPGEKVDNDLISHEGEECGFVIAGELCVHLAGETYHLKEGDSICFKSSIPHRFENCGSMLSRSIWAITPPTF
ncbi:helix-turn-helix domain-containing protein [Desulfoscipio geothermicus]|uniref:Transcriptional regulator, XRE family with cupin sensor n=1 Tax=Desulfoscipio geothermicus DSM 3669 TaxID=1121426 RepID=A0A1I6DTC7_9FIRM|nr:XRE family transcriptional regulator [Desulfoscipio geothermicus]SFR08601.1 transcriptional regulator, XRE family with cupin sensor [Desulfoscipio geothermicus DSM 3669]